MKLTKNLGICGELAVVRHLQEQGFTICMQNYRKFFGEIDIIARKKNIYVFVEVKTRKNSTMPMGHLVSPLKQLKIIKTAQNFIAEHQLEGNYICRFDVALVTKNDINFAINYIENAFTKKEDTYDY